MNLAELKASAEAAIHYGFGCGDPECRCFACLAQPDTILKLIAVCEAAQESVAIETPVYLIAALRELEK